MNLQQLEYIIAVDTHRHFVKAAEQVFVTQATLSMMIKKLEDELGVKIFDRSKVPVIPTDVGKEIIEQARKAIKETQKIDEIVQDLKGTVKGQMRIGIIPTLAPYLLPLFLSDFIKSFPSVKLQISELNTETIIKELEDQTLDAGILATPLNKSTLNERPLFYEQFVVYASSRNMVMKKKYLLPSDIDMTKLWLLEEGHCLRNQALNLCELKKQETGNANFMYEAGSIETLKKMVDINDGLTIIPELSLADLSEEQQDRIRYFKNPAPAREISIVTYRHYAKDRLIKALEQSIMRNLPIELQKINKKKVTEVF